MSEFCYICHNLTGDSGLCGICRIVLDVWDIDINKLGDEKNE